LSKNVKIKIHKTIILIRVLYGCEMPVILREEQRLAMFENRMVMGTFGLKWDEMVEGLRNLYKEQLRNLQSYQT
jgi:hypothetical protein